MSTLFDLFKCLSNVLSTAHMKTLPQAPRVTAEFECSSLVLWVAKKGIAFHVPFPACSCLALLVLLHETLCCWLLHDTSVKGIIKPLECQLVGFCMIQASRVSLNHLNVNFVRLVQMFVKRAIHSAYEKHCRKHPESPRSLNVALWCYGLLRKELHFMFLFQLAVAWLCWSYYMKHRAAGFCMIQASRVSLNHLNVNFVRLVQMFVKRAIHSAYENIAASTQSHRGV